MAEHLPILQILIPLLAAPFCLLLRRRGPVLGFGIVAAWATFAVSCLLLARVHEHGTQSYALGGWPAPWGIEYRVDLLSSFVLMFVSAVGAVVLTYTPASIAREVPQDRHGLFVVAYLLCLAGLLGIAATGDLFNLFVFLEISSLSSYALISLGRRRQALSAAFQYLILGTIGATFLLIGIGMAYMITGTLNMVDMAARLPAASGSRTVLVAFAFLTVGVGLKMALFPLHIWLPNAYAYSPSAVGAFLAATATKVSVYVMVRLVFTVFGVELSFGQLHLDRILTPMALAGIFVASTVAIFQRDVKRMLAYSSVAQIGYMVLGISLASVSGLTAGILHLFNHALMKGGMFLALGCMAWHVGTVEIDRLGGIGRRMPLTTFAWVLGGLGLIGVPLTVGFVSKWTLIGAAIEGGYWPVAVLVLLSSLLAVVYVWRVVEVFYFRAPSAGAPDSEAPWSMILPTYLLIGASLLFGIWTRIPTGIARRAAEILLPQ